MLSGFFESQPTDVASRVAGRVSTVVVVEPDFVNRAFSTVAQNQAQAMQLSMLTTMPAILLSGYIAPRENLPLPLYLLGDLFPVTHFIQISRGIVSRGEGLTDLLPSVGWLVLLCVVLIAASTSRFRKSMS